METAASHHGYVKDARGRLVPLSLVRPAEKLEDELVRNLHLLAEQTRAALAAFRDKCLGDIGALLQLIDEQYNAPKGGIKGNLTLTSYDGLLRIQVAMSDQLTFGPELQTAKTLVDQCIRSWSEGANAKLLAIVNTAFDVDKEGKLNVGRILALRRYDIDDDAWRKAMEAIGAAIRVDVSKQYLRFYVRNAPDEKFQQVPLDLASV